MQRRTACDCRLGGGGHGRTAVVSDGAADALLEDGLAAGHGHGTPLLHTGRVVPDAVTHIARLRRVRRNLKHSIWEMFIYKSNHESAFSILTQINLGFLTESGENIALELTKFGGTSH